MSALLKSQVGRSAAILTTGEVAGTTLDLEKCKDGVVVVDLSFTIGSLTNGIVRFYGSMDGTTFDPIAKNGAVVSETLTASGERNYVMDGMRGLKYFRVSIQGTGTVTSSTTNFTYRFVHSRSRR